MSKVLNSPFQSALVYRAPRRGARTAGPRGPTRARAHARPRRKQPAASRYTIHRRRVMLVVISAALSLEAFGVGIILGSRAG
jgi:hypothetical protein